MMLENVHQKPISTLYNCVEYILLLIYMFSFICVPLLSNKLPRAGALNLNAMHQWTVLLFKLLPVFSVTHHYNDVIMSAMAFEITTLTIVYSIVYSGAYKKTHQNSSSLAFVQGIHQWPVNSPHKEPVTRRKMYPFDDVIMTFKIGDRLRWNIVKGDTRLISSRV